jgi:hypothetical protein
MYKYVGLAVLDVMLTVALSVVALFPISYVVNLFYKVMNWLVYGKFASGVSLNRGVWHDDVRLRIR